MLNQILSIFFSGLILLASATEANTSTEFTPNFKEDPWAVTLFDENPAENQARLWSQTKLMLGLGVGVLGALAVMPESFTNWEKSEMKQFHKEWWSNVTSGPVVDKDDFFLNYITHPYFGGVYYVVARESGYNQWNSFVYSFLMSTFYWEYGIEAIAETPSWQDIIVTPVGGWLYGEWAFQRKRMIINDNGQLWGSSRLGSTALFFLDPVDSIDQWINSDQEEPLVEDLDIRLAFTPTFYQVKDQNKDSNYFGLVLSFRI